MLRKSAKLFEIRWKFKNREGIINFYFQNKRWLFQGNWGGKKVHEKKIKQLFPTGL